MVEMSAPMSQTTKDGTEAGEGYCPHCFLLVDDAVERPWPRLPQRCPHCRLLIGPGRGRENAKANPGARGTAAGVFAHRAKHSEDGEQASPDEIRAAIRQVAEKLDARPERLLMVDYQQRALADDELPPLGDVLSAFGSWKSARKEAAAA